MGQLKAVCKVRFTEGSVAYAIIGLRSGIVVVDGKRLLSAYAKKHPIEELKVDGLVVVTGSNPYIRSVEGLPEFNIGCRSDEIQNVSSEGIRNRFAAKMRNYYYGASVVTWMLACNADDKGESVIKIIADNVRGIDLLDADTFKRCYKYIEPARVLPGKKYECIRWWLKPEYAGSEPSGDCAYNGTDRRGKLGQYAILQDKRRSAVDCLRDNQHASVECGVRPILYLTGNALVGSKFKFGGYDFTVISDGIALCDECIRECSFSCLALMTRIMNKWMNLSKKGVVMTL